MSEAIRPFDRQKLFLNLLRVHGPLSVRTLRKLIVPTMSIRSIQLVLKRLQERKLVGRRTDELPENVGAFYQLKLTTEAIPEIAKILGVSVSDVKSTGVRNRELFHSQDCAIWSDYLEALFPDARIYREHHFSDYESIRRALISSAADVELRPDIILQADKAEGNGAINIAIEIERTRKTHRKLLNKLKKFATSTLLDGVVYISDKDGIKDTLRRLYKGNIVSGAGRIRQYGDHFILFSPGFLKHTDRDPYLVNTELQNVSFKKWVQILSSTERQLRRDFKF